jgi:uncharacterized protein with HEPN domain
MKNDIVYIRHIMDAIKFNSKDTSVGRNLFLLNRTLQDAVNRTLEVMGEATKNLSSVVRDSYSEVPWKRMSGMRDKMIHEYFGVNIELIWEVVETDLPSLKKNIDHIIHELEKK